MPEEKNERYINSYTDFGFTKLFEQAEIAKYTPVERREYEASVKDYWDYYSTMKTANLKGRAEGRAEGLSEGLVKGRAEGRAEGILEIARKMKAKGMSLEDIAEMTGVSVGDIDN